MASIDFIVRNGLQVYGNVGIGTTSNAGIGTGNVSATFGKAYYAGNIQLANTSTISGILFADGTYQNTAAYQAGFSASNVTVTSTTTNSTFYPTFVEATSGNLGIRVDTTFTYNPSTDALTAGQFIPSSSTAPSNGIFLPSANTLGFATNGSERARIDSSGNVGVGTSSVSSGNVASIYGGNVFVAGNIRLGNTATRIGGIQFPDGTFQSTALTPSTLANVAAFSASNITVTATTTDLTFYVAFFEGTTANIGARVNNSFTYNPAKNTISLGNIISSKWEGQVITASYGGTGISSYVQGDLLYASSATTLNTLNSVGTGVGPGNVLVNGALGPTWGSVDLSSSSAVKNTLGVIYGGTGNSTQFTTGSVVFAGASGVYTQDNTNFFWDNTNKRLGLGTASPSQALDVNGSVLFRSNAQVLGNIVVNNSARSGNLSITNTTAATSTTTGALIVAGGVGVAGNAFVGGNIGIGTSSTQGYRLYTIGNSKVTGSVDVDVSFLGQPNDTATTPSYSWTGDQSTGMFRPSMGNIGFSTNGIERVRISTDGFVGIGTGLPASKLQVAGNVIVSNVMLYGGFSYGGGNLDVSALDGSVEGVWISNDGTLLYTIGNGTDRIQVHGMSTPWQISTATYLGQSAATSTQNTNPNGLAMSPDGRRAWITGIAATNGNVGIYEYDLSTPWVVTSGFSYTNNILVTTDTVLSPTGVFWKSDGRSLFVVGNSATGTAPRSVVEFEATIPWSIGSMSNTVVSSFSVAGQEPGARGLSFTGDGTRMFIIGPTGDDVTIYDLSIPWNINTASHRTQYSLSALVSNITVPTDMFISPDGSKLYVTNDVGAGAGNVMVYQFEMPVTTVDMVGAVNISGSASVAQDLKVYGKLSVGSSANFSGNVGIGTSSPESLLHLSSIGPAVITLEADTDNITETDNPRIIMKQDGGQVQSRIGIANNTNSLEIMHEFGDSLILGTSNTTRVTIDSSGNVGINTTAPSQRLDVAGNAIVRNSTWVGNLSIANTTAATSTTTGALVVGGGAGVSGNLHVGGTIYGAVNTAINASNVVITATSTNATFYPAFVEATSGNLGIRVDTTFTYNPSTDSLTAGQFIPTSSTVPTNGMYLPAANTLGFATNGTIAMGMDANNNVSISNTNYRSNLEVGSNSANATIRAGGIWSGNTTANLNEEVSRHQLVFSSYRDVQTNTVGAKIVSINYAVFAAGGVGNYYKVQQADLAFFTLGSTPSTIDNTVERMRIDRNGNVGIGSTSPLYPLDVVGGARFTGTILGVANTAINASNVVVTPTTTNSNFYPTFVEGSSGNLGIRASTSTTFVVNPGAAGGLQVGIGTSTPSARLGVGGTLFVNTGFADSQTRAGAATISYNPGSNFVLGADPTDTLRNTTLLASTAGRPIILTFRSLGNSVFWDFIADDNTSKFYIQKPNQSPVITWDNSNRVGIGTTALVASAVLTVSGNVVANNSVLVGNMAVTNTTATTSTTTGALTVAGGVGIAGNLYVGGNLVVNGNVTYINTNVAVIEDPSITIGTGPNGANLTVSDSYDRGLEFHYFSGGGDRYGFLGWQNSSGKLTYITNATAGSTTGIYSGVFGDAQLGNLVLGGAAGTATPATSASTGALIINGSGGIGVGGNIYVGGTIFGAVNTAVNASNMVITATATNATFYPAFVEATSGNLGIRVDTSFTYNPSTDTLVLQNLNSAAATALSIDSGTTGDIGIGTSATAKTIRIGNQTGATTMFVNSGTGGTTFATSGAGTFSFINSSVPTTDMIQIVPGFGIATAGVNALSVTYLGGAAAIESSATRTDITPSGTPGSTWSAYRMVANGAASGVTLNAMKVDNITATAGSNNALWIGSGWGNIINLGNSVLIRGDGAYAGSVNNINVISTTTNATFYPAFFEATSGALAPRIDTTFTYNPSTDALTAGQFIPSSSTAPTNGMFLPAANTVGFATNGSGERIRITSGGFVGIGTTNPPHKLSVYGGSMYVSNLSGYRLGDAGGVGSSSLTAQGDDNVVYYNANNVPIWSATNSYQSLAIFGANASVRTQWTASSNSIVNITSGVIRMTIDSSGNVGIGTSTVASGNVASIYGGNLFLAGNLRLGNTAASMGGIQFPDGTFQSTALTSSTLANVAAFSASNITVTATTTDTTFYVAFFEGTTANIGARVNNSFTYNPAKNTISLGNIISSKWEGQVITASYGGTGISSYVQGDLLYASSATTLNTLNSVGTGVGPGNVLVNGVSGPTWGSVDLSSLSAVKNTLGVGNGGTGSSTQFTTGSVVFAGASGVYTQDNTNFFWDNTNKRLGLGTISPSQALDVNGSVLFRSNAQVLGNVVINNSARTGNLSITNTTAATSTTTGALIVAGGVGVAGNVYAGNIYTTGTFFGVANTAINASNLVVTATATNATFYPAFVEGTSGNLGIRTDTSFTYNPSTDTLVLQNLNSAAATALSIDSGTTGDLSIGTSANAKNITIGNLTGATRLFVNAGTGGTTFHTPGTASIIFRETSAPTVDVVQIIPGFGISTSGVNALSVTYVGGAAAIESSATRTDLTASGTSGSTWSGYRIVANGAVSGVTVNAMKVDNITASAGSNNALWIGSGWGNIINLGNSVLIRGDGAYAGSVNNINVISTTTNATFYPAFFEATSGALAPRVDTSLTYNPSTDALTSGQFIPSSSTAPANGMFLPAANNVGFATNTSERVRIDNNGNVGISTNSPTQTLDVNGNVLVRNSAWVGNLAITNTTTSTSTTTGALTVAGGVGIAGNLFTSASAWHGNLAITNTTTSTSTTTGALTVAGGAAVGGNLYVNNSLVVGNTAQGQWPLQWTVNTILYPPTAFGAAMAFNFSGGQGEADFMNQYTSAAQSFRWYQQTAAAAATLLLQLTNGGTGIFAGGMTATNTNVTGSTAPANGTFLPAANSLGFSTNTTERMRIDSSGLVGIGTTSMSSGNAVTVYGGNIFVAGNIRVGNTATAIGGIQFSDGTFQSTAATISDDTTTNAPRYINFTSATSGTLGTINTSSTKLIYYPLTGNLTVGGNLTVSNAAGISTFAGNVGIGTTTPTAGYLLSVNGGIAATTKSFVINHPTKPGMKLQHASLEGPENGVYLRGRLSGNDRIMLPDYWKNLVDIDTITVNLTPIGKHAHLYVEEITDEHITVGVDTIWRKPLINCFYTVYAERKDVPRLRVEV